MARPRSTTLKVCLNGRHVGTLRRAGNGAVTFAYEATWLTWEHGFPISISMPLREEVYSGDAVSNVFDNLLPANFALIPQRGDGFGERLLATTEDLFACGYGSVCLIDSDSPTVPAAAFHQAVAELAKPGDRIVLGPSHDGGYYLIGLKRAHPEPFFNISWSTPAVFAETIAAAKAAGIEVSILPLWYDVDDAASLDLLIAELLYHNPPPFTTVSGYPARYTRAFLHTLNQHLDNRK